MLFHTWPFLIFFAITYSIYLLLRHNYYRIHWLLFASYFFYGWWNPLYLPLILFSTLVDYWSVIQMDRSGRRKLWLIISLVNNLGLLAFFKYAKFFTDNINTLLESAGIDFVMSQPADVVWQFGAGLLNDIFATLGLQYSVPMQAVLPVGISFYTFQSMSYTIDFYRGNIERERSFVRFAAYVALFPQLVAGPIERASELLPQLAEKSRIRIQDVTDGMSLFVVGLFKKVALADYLGRYVDQIYAAPNQYQSAALFLATFAFAWQIYFDFSGYTDMARGVGRALGFRFMLNFNHPYIATGLGDFWSRWHISLSTWFRDYVYKPLGGNRRGRLLTLRNLFLTFVISGLWHGAAWTFVIWGTCHGLGLILTRRLERSNWYVRRIPRLLKIGWVFAFVCLTWVFFRAQNLADAVSILQGMAAVFTRVAEMAPAFVFVCFTFVFLRAQFLEVAMSFLRGIVESIWANPKFPVLALLLIALVWLYQYLHETRFRSWLQTPLVKIALVVAMIVYLFLMPGTPDRPFIYFQF